MHINEINKANICFSPDWQLTFHELYYLSPDMADALEGCPEGFGIWHSHFGQDLLQMKNANKGQVLDVGWYPHADPSGSFVLKLIAYSPSLLGDKREEYRWESPLVRFKTRCIDTLLKKIGEIVQ